MPYYFSWFIAPLFRDQSVYFHISNSVGIISPVEFANKASHFDYKLWEDHGLTGEPIITDICVWAIYASCFSYFSNHPSENEQKLI
jgi:hypothetical protein